MFSQDGQTNRHADPLDRVLGYIDFRKAILTGKLPEFTCLVGTMVQGETYPDIRDACDASISGHAETVEADIAEAIAPGTPSPPIGPRKVSYFTPKPCCRALVAVNSPSEVVELSTAYARQQFDAVSTQSKELWALSQKIATDVAEPIKTGVFKAFQMNA